MDMKDNFFNVYLCNVCKSKESFSHSKLCSGSSLISYCSREHQKIDWKSHKTICKAVQKVCDAGGKNLYNIGMLLLLLHEPTVNMMCVRNPSGCVFNQVWAAGKRNVQLILEKHLERSVNRLEMQMIYFPRHCAVCYTREIKKELVCLNCFGAAYCSAEHQASNNHQSVCSDFQKALDMDVFMLNVDLDSLETHLIKSDHAINLKLDAYDMRSFIAKYVKPGLKWEEETLISFYYSSVLTFAYIINRIPGFTLGKRLVIHIVGAVMHEEGRVVNYWENLLHLFPGVQHLLIVHIGPCINMRMGTWLSNGLRLCLDCRRANKSFDCFFFEQLYHDYHKHPGFMKPDVIIAFNTGVYTEGAPSVRWDWDSTLPFFFRYKNVPFISTDFTKSAGEEDLKKLLGKNAIGDKKVSTVVKCEKNPFNNLRVWRLHDGYDGNDPVFIKNGYVFALIVESG